MFACETPEVVSKLRPTGVSTGVIKLLFSTKLPLLVLNIKQQSVPAKVACSQADPQKERGKMGEGWEVYPCPDFRYLLLTSHQVGFSEGLSPRLGLYGFWALAHIVGMGWVLLK